MSMSFRPAQLRYFVTVAEEGQVTSAAKKLDLAQPALSQAISQLEAELGLQLLERHARGVRLTVEGKEFLPKARAAVQSEQDAEREARSLAAGEGTLEVGFVGPPPTINASQLFSAFQRAHREVEVSFRDLPFPRGSTGHWLGSVDVAFCHRPDLDPTVQVKPVRAEPRALVAHKSHPLAAQKELPVEAVLDQTFISYHPAVQAAWAGFHSLDDHRGGPPGSVTADHVATSLQMLGILSTGRAVAAVPACDARIAASVLPDVVAIPLIDADPAILSLVCHASACPPLVRALLDIGDELAERGSTDDADPPERGLLRDGA
jgi:LysR family transcriptional regulator, hca operon transcriptional activator